MSLSQALRHSLHTLLLALGLAMPATLLAQDPAAAADPAAIAAGQSIFENYCKTCHNVHGDKVGPALTGVDERRSIDWIISWVHNPQGMIDKGDKHALEVYSKYKAGGVMQGFPNLKPEEIKSVVAYIKSVPPPAAGPVDNGTGGGTVAAAPQDNTLVSVLLVAFTFVLVLILIVLGAIITILTRILKQRDGLSEADDYLVNQKLDFAAVFKSKIFIYLVAFFCVAMIGKATIDGLENLGMQQGYAPAQPIPFSHKLHAGKMEIDCNYCHTGVRIGKSANIPSANICMNCHSVIKQGSPKLKPLYDAIETGKPIEWVRVHNLPDLAYFNHQQHVLVGGLECQTCHGPIETMEVVQQYSPLTMGWCINCHRETVVKSGGNAYYDKLLATHKAAGGKDLKVKDIGGLDCSKCHY